MLLLGPKQTSLEIQFAGRPDNEGWLSVVLAARSEEGGWSARDPCLLAQEVPLLAQWLDAVSEAREETGDLSFLEPELSFAVLTSGRRTFRVFLRYNLRPPWLRQSGEDSAPYYIDFPAETGMLKGAAENLWRQFDSWGR